MSYQYNLRPRSGGYAVINKKPVRSLQFDEATGKLDFLWNIYYEKSRTLSEKERQERY